MIGKKTVIKLIKFCFDFLTVSTFTQFKLYILKLLCSYSEFENMIY